MSIGPRVSKVAPHMKQPVPGERVTRVWRGDLNVRATHLSQRCGSARERESGDRAEAVGKLATVHDQARDGSGTARARRAIHALDEATDRALSQLVIATVEQLLTHGDLRRQPIALVRTDPDFLSADAQAPSDLKEVAKQNEDRQVALGYRVPLLCLGDLVVERCAAILVFAVPEKLREIGP